MQLAAKTIDDAASYRGYYTQELLELLACDLAWSPSPFLFLFLSSYIFKIIIYMFFSIRERPSTPMGRAQIKEFDPLVQWFKDSVGLELSVSHDSIECDHPERTTYALSLYWDTLVPFPILFFNYLFPLALLEHPRTIYYLFE